MIGARFDARPRLPDANRYRTGVVNYDDLAGCDVFVLLQDGRELEGELRLLDERYAVGDVEFRALGDRDDRDVT